MGMATVAISKQGEELIADYFKFSSYISALWVFNHEYVLILKSEKNRCDFKL